MPAPQSAVSVKLTDLSGDVHIVLRFEYVGINALDEWDDPVPVPGDGAIMAAQATIGPNDALQARLRAGRPLHSPAPGV